MHCSCGNRECSCENRCVCDPDMCLCLPCYGLRDSRCQICGLLCFSENFSSPRDNAIDFCTCFFSRSEVPYQDEYENHRINGIYESTEELRNKFAVSYNASGNKRNKFRSLASSEVSTVSSQSEVSEQVANRIKTRDGSNYLSIRDTQNIRKDALRESLPLLNIEEKPFEISKVIQPSTTLEVSNIARKKRLEISPRKRNNSKDLNYVKKGMQKEMGALNFVCPPKIVSIECENDSTSDSNPSSLSSSDVSIGVTKQSNTRTKTCFSKQCDSGASFPVSSSSKVRVSPMPTSVSATIPLKPLKKSKKTCTKAKAVPHATATSKTTEGTEESVAVTNHNEHRVIPQLHNAEFLITPSVILPPPAIALLPLRTPFQPSESSTALRRATSTTRNTILGQEFQRPVNFMPVQVPSFLNVLQNPVPPVPIVGMKGNYYLDPFLARAAHWVNSLPANFDQLPSSSLSSSSDEKQKKSSSERVWNSRRI